MNLKYILIVNEHYEDHSEDERTGGVPVFTQDYEHRLPLDGVPVGEIFQVSIYTNIIIHAISYDPVKIDLSINRGSDYERHKPNERIQLSLGEPVFVWDNFNACQKTVCLESATATNL